MTCHHPNAALSSQQTCPNQAHVKNDAESLKMPHGIKAPNIAEVAEAWRLKHFPSMPWPRISIVTPSYNQGFFLDACMHSIFDQNYPNVEYIVLDGGSIDNSVQVIKSNSSKLAFWRSGPDGGQYKAVEEGLNRATGDILAWLNADDIYLGSCLYKVAMLFLSQPDIEWLTGRPVVANVMGEVSFRQKDLLWSRRQILSAKRPIKEYFMGQDAMFWRRTLWERSGSRLDHRFDLAADFELWVRFARHAVLHSARDEFSAFRFHGDQRSITNKVAYLEQLANIIDEELSLLEQEGLPEGFNDAPDFLSLPYCDQFPPAVEQPLDDTDDGKIQVKDLREELCDLRKLLAKPAYLNQAYYKDDDLALQLNIGTPNNTIKCVSFDCFDTLLYRLSDEPIKLFIEVGRRLRQEGLLSSHISPEEYRVLRQSAEERARHFSLKRRGTTECSIEEVYTHLTHLITNISRAIEIEIETEQDFCYLNENISSLIYRLKSAHKHIVIISDTYFSSQQLAAILKSNLFDTSVLDLILTSRDVGVSKTKGKLFHAALNKLHLRPEEVVHIGDNEKADVEGANAVGLHTLHYTRHDTYTRDVLWRENELANTSQNAASLGSFRVLARRNGAAYPMQWRGYFQDGAFLLGPPLARFADWIVQQCKYCGINRALVFMREAETLIPLIRNSAKAIGHHLELMPFYISRHAINLASLTECTPEVLFEKSHKHRTVPTNILLRTFGLDPAAIQEIDQETMASVLNDVERYTLAKFLSGHPIYRRLIENLAQKRRQAFLGYALPLINEYKKVAVVDLGFRGTIQRSMDIIFGHERVGTRTVGLYFCTQMAAAEKVLDGSDIRSYLGGLGARQLDLGVLLTHPEFLEQSVNSTCGSTLGYAPNKYGDCKPVLDEPSLPSEQIFKRYLIKQGIWEFQRVWLEFVVSKSRKSARQGNISDKLMEIDGEITSILRRLWSFPLPEEAERLGSLYHDDNNGTDTGDIICNASSRAAYREGGLQGLVNSLAYWPHGIIGLESPNLVENLFAWKKRLELP